MFTEQQATVVLGLMFFAAVFAALVGMSVERSRWLKCAQVETGAEKVAHCCEGHTYYIVEICTFESEYGRLRLKPPQGGSGTAPPQRKS